MTKKQLLKLIDQAAKDGRTELDLSHKDLTELPPEIGNLTNLTTLYLASNQLTALPPEILQLTNLTSLYFQNNRLTALPPEIGHLTNLTSLDLDSNQLTALPPEIAQLTNLTSLDLRSNQLTALPPEILQLTNLKSLYFQNNRLTALPPEIVQLTKLTSLDLRSNQLTEIPHEFTQLANLTSLDLSSNQLMEIPPEIGKLTKLTSLDLDSNQLTALPPEIGKLTKLTSLDLAGNQLTALPPEIGQLAKLESLDLAGNHLTALPPEIGQLAKLESLDLAGNQLTALPPEITQLTNLTSLDLESNPLKEPPPEIAEQGIKAIAEYFKSLEGEKQPLNEVKVLLVGDGYSGKTSLVKQIRGEKFNKSEPQTHGINIRDWKIQVGDKDIIVHFWDFGGQEIMHATHQFFLSRRSLYILVVDGRKDEKIEYWLKHIESFGGDSPILVVLNKMDENPGFDVNRRFLQEKYKGIKSFHRISCAKKTGIDELSQALSQALLEVKILETTWPTSWFNVKTCLEKMRKRFISYKAYRRICSKNNVTEKSSQDTLVDFLNDLGVILHFKELRLKDTHVLEPRWVTQAVYRIINSEQLANTHGVLNLTSLDKILKKSKKEHYPYPPDKYAYIIDLMMKFELCYEIDRETVLIPDLLEVQEPALNFGYKNSLRFLIEYDFLPKSVMPRFIVRMHKDIKKNLRWRTGLVLEDPAFSSTAVVKADERDMKIHIYVDGKQKRDYFAVIRSAFLSINSSFEKLEAVEKVPMPDNPVVTVSYDHLARLEQMGVEQYIPDGSDKAYDVKDLLGSVSVGKKTEKEMLQILKKLQADSDTKESLGKKVNQIIQLEPNFFGIGVNVNKLIEKLYGKRKKNQSKSS